MRRAGSSWIRRAGIAFAIAAATAVLADETRVLPLRHRPAAEMIPLVRPLLGPQDAIGGSDYRLIVRTSERNFREIEKLLARLDVARRPLRITVRHTAAGDTTDTRHAVSGEVGDGDVRLRLPRSTAPDNRGLTIGKADGLRYETRQTVTRTQGESAQTIATQDGARAYIRVGQSVPHVTTRLLALSRHGAAVAQDVQYRNVVTGFEVVPRVRGELVQLEITPRLARLDDPATGLASFQEASATVSVRLGEWLDLGAIAGGGEEVRRAILESAATRTGERRTILLKVE